MGWQRTTKIVQTNTAIKKANRGWWFLAAYGLVYWWFAGLLSRPLDLMFGVVLGAGICWQVGKVEFLKGLREGLGYHFFDEVQK